MYNDENIIIYVGKAKDLKNRVSQYFQSGANHSVKVAAMVENIHHYDYIITGSEFEALVLECNLIKQHQPKYNILLKDGKQHPYIRITVSEDYPRIMLSRKIEDDKERYFGPYLNTRVIYETIDIIKAVFGLRTCSGKIGTVKRPCLNYQIGKCTAPCAGHIGKDDYNKLLAEIINFLEGDYSKIIDKLQAEMTAAAENLDFERAARLRDKIAAVKRTDDRQRAISTSQGNYDVLAFAQDGTNVCLQMLFVRYGKVVGQEHHVFKSNGSDIEIMTDFIKQYYAMSQNIPSELLLQCDIYDRELIEKWLKLKISVPKRGDKTRLIEMAKNNAVETLKLHILKFDTEKRKASDLMFQIKEVLGLDKSPLVIEAYDISNISGTDSVGVCVVFENGKPKKSGYKKFNIKSVDTPDDYQSMREVLYRRLSNGVENQKGFTPLPDLILLDGGKGHVSVVSEVMEFFKLNIPLFGVVKDDKHKTRGVTTATDEIDIKRTSSVFKFLTQIQDEVHRFALASHKTKRKKTAFTSELEDIKGVGEKKREILLKHFKGIAAIKSATLEELCVVKGIDEKTAKNVFDKMREI